MWIGTFLILLLEDLRVERGIPPRLAGSPFERDRQVPAPTSRLLRDLGQVCLYMRPQRDVNVVLISGGVG